MKIISKLLSCLAALCKLQKKMYFDFLKIGTKYLLKNLLVLFVIHENSKITIQHCKEWNGHSCNQSVPHKVS